MKKFFIILLAGSLLFTNSTFAGRFGGGRSSGMQRSIAPSNANSSYKSVAPNNNINPQQRSRMGLGTAAMLGAAAGAAGGYMMGRNSNNHNASDAISNQSNSSNIPWGTILILIILLALGLMFFRKKTNPSLSSNQMNNFSSHNTNNFSLPTIIRTPNNTPNNKTTTKSNIKFGSTTAVATEQLDKMPDGIETIYFLRQAKGMFLHIQSMNNLENIGEIQKYMTAELFADIQNDITNNPTIADFRDLECQLISCEAIKPTQSDDGGSIIEAQLIATVKFFGNVSESPEQEAQQFSEMWNFIKSARTSNKWIVAGIQQEELKK